MSIMFLFNILTENKSFIKKNKKGFKSVFGISARHDSTMSIDLTKKET